MKVELSNEEIPIILDGLANLPLSRAYNLFSRILLQAQHEGIIMAPPKPTVPPEVAPETSSERT
jgi:hypothetical protein